MNKFNILDAEVVSETSLQQEIFRIQFGDKTLIVPRPVMIGLAIFINCVHCNGSNSPRLLTAITNSIFQSTWNIIVSSLYVRSTSLC